MCKLYRPRHLVCSVTLKPDSLSQMVSTSVIYDNDLPGPFDSHNLGKVLTVPVPYSYEGNEKDKCRERSQVGEGLLFDVA